MTREQIRDVRYLVDFGIDSETAVGMVEHLTRDGHRLGDLCEEDDGRKFVEVLHRNGRDWAIWPLN